MGDHNVLIIYKNPTAKSGEDCPFINLKFEPTQDDINIINKIFCIGNLTEFRGLIFHTKDDLLDWLIDHAK